MIKCVIRPVSVLSFVLQSTNVTFIALWKNKMQTDQDEQQNQGDTQKETEEKTPRENEEMEVK